MKNNYCRVLFIMLFCFCCVSAVANCPNIEGFLIKVVVPSATISGTTTTCVNSAQPDIIFTGAGGTAPYTFTYKINSGSILTVTTTSGNSVNVGAATGTVGVYTYALVGVEDSTGNSQDESGSATISIIDNFTVNAGNNITICKGSAINLSAITSNAPTGVNYSWAGPNDYSSSTSSVVRNNSTPAMSGSYTVTASVGQCERTDVVDVTVLEPTVESANLMQYQNAQWLVSCTQPGETSGVIFLNNGIPADLQNLVTAYTIDWGDSSTFFTTSNSSWNNGNNINHTYNTGLYELIITINTTLNCTINKRYNVFVGNQPASPQIQLPINAQGCVPFELTFPISGVSANIAGTTYTITFSDDPTNPIPYSQFDIPASITRTFNSSSCGNSFTNGNTTENNAFGVSMQAINPCGSASSSAGPIRTSTPPTAIVSLPANGCTNQLININDQSINGSIVTATTCNNNSGRYWVITPASGWSLSGSNLGNDGGFPANYAGWNNGSENLNIQFSTPGTYSVTLFRRNSCSGTSNDTKTICIESPLASASFTLNNTTGCGSVIAQATNTTPTANTCNISYSWAVAYATSNCGTSPGGTHNYFTNDTTSASVSPSFSFPNPGTYTVTLTASNSCSPPRTATQTVTVKAPPTAFITPISDFCGSTSASITPRATVANCGTQAILTYAWSFPGGTPLTSTSADPGAVTYSTSGPHTISLAVTNECGTTTVSEDFTISPAPVMNNVPNQDKCAGQQSDAIIFGSDLAATTYSWTNSNTSIGLVASGITNNIPAFTLQNNGTAPITSTITVTPRVGNCNGTPKIFSITVQPLPVVNLVSAISVCNGNTQDAVSFTSTVDGTLFNWVNNTPSIGLATSGTGNLPSFTAINTTGAPIVATITVTPANAQGCTGTTHTFTITVNTAPSALTLSNPNFCNAVATTPITFTNSTANTTYSWTNSNAAIGLPTSGTGNIPSFNPTNTGAAAITGTITVTPSSNGCPATAQTFTITVSPSPAVTFSQPNQTICSGSSTTAIALSSPTPGVAFTWTATQPAGVTGVTTNGTTTIPVQTLTNTTNTPVNVVYNAAGSLSGGVACAGSAFNYTVTVNPKPIINSITNTTCSSQAFTITPVNGTDGIVPANTQYSWAAPGAQTGITGLASGLGSTITGTLTNTTTTPVTIRYTVTPVSGTCTGSTFTVDVTVSPLPTVAGIASQTKCNGATTDVISFTGSVPSTVFNWTNSNPAIGLAATGTGNILAFTATNNTNTAITATIVVTPVLNGCNGATQTFNITVNPAPTVIFSIGNQTICSARSSTAVVLSSATPNTSISWTVSAPTGITGAATGGNTTSIPAQTLTNTTSSPLTVTYTASATTADASACPGAPSVYTITVNPVPFVNATQQTAICSGSPLNYIPANSGGNNMPTGVTFTWSAPTGNGFTGGGAQALAQASLNQVLINTTITPVVATYTITPQFGGCSGIPFTVHVTVNPTAIVPNSTLTLCSEDTFTFNPATAATLLPAGTTYSWSAPTGNVTGGTSGSAQTLITGTLSNTSGTTQTATYTIIPLSPDGNCNGTPFILAVTVNPVFAASSTVSNYNGFQISTAGANDGFINLNPTGGTGTYTYSWTGPAGFTASAQNIANIGPGTYSVTITDGLCTGITLSFNFIEPMPLVIAEVLASHINVDCFGQSTGVIEVEITQVSIAPFDYAVLLADGTVIEDLQNLTTENFVFDNLPAGTYNIRVTDANGTVKYINGIQITQPATGLEISNALVSNFNGFSTSCNGAQNGSIDLSVTGGYPGYTFAWTGPDGFTATTEDISALNPGVYTIIIRDTTNACPVTESYTITEPQVVAFTGTVPDFNGYHVSCFGSTNGSITIAPVGGTSVYTYAWTGTNGFTASTQNIANLPVGIYQLVVTDSNGCSAPSQTFTLTQPNALSISESHVNVLCFGAATGSIDVTVTGGVITAGIYTYSWTGPGGYTSAAEDLINVTAGTYNLVATDANGCTIPLSVTLTQQPEIIITPTTTPITCYGANNASISLAITGGDAPYTTTWGNLATGTYQDNLAAGNYIITVTDDSGCVKNITVTIPEAPVFMVTPIATNISCNGAHDGSITLNLVGGVAPVTLVWSDGSTAGTQRNNLAAGTYTATISDNSANHCQITRTFTIIEPAALTVTANITHALVCDDTMSGAINLLVAGGTPPYVYNWSNGTTTEDLMAITSGTYTVTVTDAGGCSNNGTYTITRPAPITLNVTENVTFNCATRYVQQVNTAQAAGGVPPFQYTWTSGTVSGTNGQYMSTNENGTVIVTATDSKGCTATQNFDVATQQLGEAAFTADSYGFTTYQIYSVFDEVQFTNASTGDYIGTSWDFGDGSASSSENPKHTYVREGTYVVTLTASYSYGCTDTYHFTIIVTKGYDVMVPNGFTPNGDGTNDSFSPLYRGLKSIELNIYDTWGALLFHEKGEVISGWDGQMKQVQSENGNFYYRIKAETFYGHIINFEGPFVLIK